MTLLTDLTAAGLAVRPASGWETASNGNRDRDETVGIVNHWDAIKGEPDISRYQWDNRYGGILYHIVIRRNGTLDLLCQRYAWHAGSGDPDILAVAQAGGPVPDDEPTDVSAAGRINGNPHFFSVCINYHPDDGPVPTAQYEALVETNAVLMAHFDLDVGQVFRHMDWTTRKRDIDTINLAAFRDDIGAIMSAPNIDEVSSWAVNSWNWAYKRGLLSDQSHPKDQITKEELMVFLKRYEGTSEQT